MLNIGYIYIKIKKRNKPHQSFVTLYNSTKYYDIFKFILNK